MYNHSAPPSPPASLAIPFLIKSQSLSQLWGLEQLQRSFEVKSEEQSVIRGEASCQVGRLPPTASLVLLWQDQLGEGRQPEQQSCNCGPAISSACLPPTLSGFPLCFLWPWFLWTWPGKRNRCGCWEVELKPDVKTRKWNHTPPPQWLYMSLLSSCVPCQSTCVHKCVHVYIRTLPYPFIQKYFPLVFGPEGPGTGPSCPSEQSPRIKHQASSQSYAWLFRICAQSYAWLLRISAIVLNGFTPREVWTRLQPQSMITNVPWHEKWNQSFLFKEKKGGIANHQEF